MASKGSEKSEVFEAEARRTFLKNCGKYAAATPPAIALLLSMGDAKANHGPLFSAGNPACNNPGQVGDPHCPQGLQGATQGTTEGATDPELNDPELNAQ